MNTTPISTPVQSSEPAQSPTKYLWLIALIPLWVMQYGLWVPTVWMWRVTVWTFKAAAASTGLLLLAIFVPILGLIIVAIILMMRPRGERPAREPINTTPWFISLVREPKVQA